MSHALGLSSTESRQHWFKKTICREVDIESLESLHLRTVGVEHVGLHAMEQLGFIKKLEELGIQGTLRDAIVGNTLEYGFYRL